MVWLARIPQTRQQLNTQSKNIENDTGLEMMAVKEIYSAYIFLSP